MKLKFEGKILQETFLQNLKAGVSRNAFFRGNVNHTGDGWNLSPKLIEALHKLRKELKRVGLLEKLQKISEELDIIGP